MNQTKNQIKKIKLIALAFILFSNASLVLLLSDHSTQAPELSPALTPREDYIKLKVSAHMHTDFYYQKPVSVVLKDQKLTIHGSFLEQVSQEPKGFGIDENLQIKNSDDLILSIHKSQFNKIARSRDIHIYPALIQYNFLSKKRKSHDIQIHY